MAECSEEVFCSEITHEEYVEDTLTTYFRIIRNDITEIAEYLRRTTLLNEKEISVKIKYNHLRINKLFENVSENIDIKNFEANLSDFLEQKGYSLLSTKFKNLHENYLNLVKTLKELKFSNELSSSEEIKRLIEKLNAFNNKLLDFENKVTSELPEYEEQLRNGYKKIKTSGFPIERIVWLDNNLENTENSSYFEKLKHGYSELEVIRLLQMHDLAKLIPLIAGNKSNRTILIASGKTSDAVIEECRNKINICKIIVFCFNIERYKEEYKLKNNKKVSIVNEFQDVLNLIDESLSGKIKNDYLLPIDFNRVPEKIHRYLSMDKYGFKSFNEVSKQKTEYDTIQKIVKLEGWKWDNVDEQKINDDIKILIDILIEYYDDQKISKKIIALYTGESPFYKIINRCLGSVNDNCISSCKIWIQALKLALETLDTNVKN